MSASTHADAVGLAAHDIPCTNLADSSATTIAELAQGKLAVLGAAQPPARPRRWKPRALRLATVFSQRYHARWLGTGTRCGGRKRWLATLPTSSGNGSRPR